MRKVLLLVLLGVALTYMPSGCDPQIDPNDLELVLVTGDGSEYPNAPLPDPVGPTDAPSEAIIKQDTPSRPEPGKSEPVRPEQSVQPEPRVTERNNPPEPPATDTPTNQASVSFVSPADGAKVKNPVTFEIKASGVYSVRLFRGTSPLGGNWQPQSTTKQTHTLTIVNQPITITLRGYDVRGQELTSSSITITVDEPKNMDKGTLVGKLYITYYYLSLESNYSGAADTTLYDKNCKAIVKVPAKFSDSACIEGSGRLKDGRIINYAKTCSCGRRCPTGGIVCYSVLDKNKYPWGAGAFSNALRPLRSLAVDRNRIPLRTKLYIPEWDGVKIPAIDGIGGFTHDGCVYADDVGGAIKGAHFDFFAGTSKMWKALEKIHGTKKYLTVYKNPGRCP